MQPIYVSFQIIYTHIIVNWKFTNSIACLQAIVSLFPNVTPILSLTCDTIPNVILEDVIFLVNFLNNAWDCLGRVPPKDASDMSLSISATSLKPSQESTMTNVGAVLIFESFFKLFISSSSAI